MDEIKLESLDKRVRQIMSELKDFQRATVTYLFDKLMASRQDHKHDRMLVADEVGLGKTLVAKGVIALLYQEFVRRQADHINVVYICSNQGIASQNLSKLTILEGDGTDNISATRLTMLSVHQRKADSYLNLISLTPATSFQLTQGEGWKEERVILYLILSSMPAFAGQDALLLRHLRRDVTPPSWQRTIEQGRVNYLPRLDPAVVQRFQAMLADDPVFLAEFQDLLQAPDPATIADPLERRRFRVHMSRKIGRLRQILAQVCVESLQPDLVIMDEFQRFKELLPDNTPGSEQSEVGQLTSRLFSTPQLMILLLSATPYKLYATTEEVAEGENHLAEFLQVMDFLCNDPEEFRQLQEQWHLYSGRLLSIAGTDIGELRQYKNQVEARMRVLIARTERLIVSESGDALIDTIKSNQPLPVEKGEIETYIAMDQVVKAMQERQVGESSPVDYSKSAAFPLSFMDHYALKNNLRKALAKDASLAGVLRKNSGAWLNIDKVRAYQPLSCPNTRLKALLREAFDGPAEQLLWLPPTLPCYPPQGVFAKTANMSKILVFSCWEMVPRMIACLVSYEAEQRTIGHPDIIPGRDETRKRYFSSRSERRTPTPRLVFRALPEDGQGFWETGPDDLDDPDGSKGQQPGDGRERGQMSNFTLLYPSLTLAESFDVAESLRHPQSYAQLQQHLAGRFREIISEAGLDRYCSAGKTRPDPAWYWAAPILLDKKCHLPTVKNWLSQSDPFEPDSQKDHARQTHWDLVRRMVKDKEPVSLGQLPPDLAEHLALMALGSPAVLVLRSLLALAPDADPTLRLQAAAKLADDFRDKFNIPESIAAIDLSIGQKGFYWQRVLHYCAQGCLQSVLDEYLHMLRDSQGLRHRSGDRRVKVVTEKLDAALSLHTAQLKVESLANFLGLDPKEYNLRVHFAACYRNMISDNKSQMRADQVRDAFNSPFRPFVLATTSIGQEGLDFHYYCRKVMHWNLPHNPIDLEQREGRINRYKGLAVRSILAWRYAGQTAFNKHGTEWDDLFDRAAEVEKGGRCDLVPYWHVEPKPGEPRIERIVPYCPLSREEKQLEWLVNVLAVYRISLGQARQEELVRFILNRMPEEKRRQIHKLLLNLSPVLYEETIKA